MYDTFTGYLKKSFKTIFENLILFVPVLFSLLLGFGIVMIFILSGNFRNMAPQIMSRNIVMVLVLALIGIIIELFIDAGKLNMIRQVVASGKTNMDDFKSGAKRYAGRIFLGGLLIFGIAALIFLIVGLIMIGIGKVFSFIAIPRSLALVMVFFIGVLVLYIFISFWKTILVYEDCGVTESIKLSISFAKKHFGLVLVINILRGIFTGKNNVNRQNNRFPNNSISFGRYFNIGLPLAMNHLGMVSAIAVIVSIVKAFFTLYFDVIFFIIYHDRRDSIFTEDEPQDNNFDTV